MENKEIGNVMKLLDELKEDTTVPKNVRLKIENSIKILDENKEIEIKVSRVLNVLEEVAEDVNLQAYTRTQIWDLISGLEKVKN